MPASGSPRPSPGRRLLHRVRAELSGLTTRGRSFISAGVASAICAVLLGQADLLRVAVLLIALPLTCLVFLARTTYRMGLARAVEPLRVPAGSPLRVRLELQNLSRGSANVLLAEDSIPPALGTPTRFVLDRLASGRKVAVTYSLRAAVRGRYPVGPLTLRVSDPFGLCETSRAFSGTSAVTVVPQHWPLGELAGGGAWSGSGESQSRAAAVHGEDDAAIREYRDGDDLRRVHWRLTAKRNELMVRREEQPRQRKATVLLDSRVVAHRGPGWASSYEWAVRMATSAVLHLGQAQYATRLLLGEPRADGQAAPGWTSPQSGAELNDLVDRLAVTALQSEAHSLESDLDLLRHSPDRLVVAVLGEIGGSQLDALARLRVGGARCLAVLLHTAEWDVSVERDATGGPAPGPDGAETAEVADAAEALLGAGWLVAEAHPASTGTEVWAEAARLGDGWGAENVHGATGARTGAAAGGWKR